MSGARLAALAAAGLLPLAGGAVRAAPPPAGRVELVLGEGLSEPFAVDFDGAGHTYMAEMGGHRVTVRDASGGRRVLADDLKGPHHLLVGPDGALYVADTWNYRVRRFDLRTGASTVVAGTGEKAFGGDGGPTLSAQLNGPKHIFVEPVGDVLMTDTENHVTRRYSPRDGTIRRVAGTGVQGNGGLGGPALECPLNRPHGAVVQSRTGALYIADSENHQVLRVSLEPQKRR